MSKFYVGDIVLRGDTAFCINEVEYYGGNIYYRYKVDVERVFMKNSGMYKNTRVISRSKLISILYGCDNDHGVQNETD